MTRENVAFIPVRGGSKSIPLKNIKLMNGKPLVYWVINAAEMSSYIDKIYVATDSKEIENTVNGMHMSKVAVIGRSPETVSDHASTESAMLEFAQNYDFDNVALIQATSPLLQTDDLDKGFRLFMEADTDSVLSVVRQKRFVWQQDDIVCGEGVSAVNYDILNRPRRQEFEGYLVENGAFYITSKRNLVQSGCRISGKIKAVEMAEESYFEIDEPGDWVIVEQLLKKRMLRSG